MSEIILFPGSNGTGGMMVDMGTPFTFMERSIYNVVAEEVETQMFLLNSTRFAGHVESLGPICFNVSIRRNQGLTQS